MGISLVRRLSGLLGVCLLLGCALQEEGVDDAKLSQRGQIKERQFVVGLFLKPSLTISDLRFNEEGASSTAANEDAVGHKPVLSTGGQLPLVEDLANFVGDYAVPTWRTTLLVQVPAGEDGSLKDLVNVEQAVARKVCEQLEAASTRNNPPIPPPARVILVGAGEGQAVGLWSRLAALLADKKQTPCSIGKKKAWLPEPFALVTLNAAEVAPAGCGNAVAKKSRKNNKADARGTVSPGAGGVATSQPLLKVHALQGTPDEAAKLEARVFLVNHGAIPAPDHWRSEIRTFDSADSFRLESTLARLERAYFSNGEPVSALTEDKKDQKRLYNLLQEQAGLRLPEGKLVAPAAGGGSKKGDSLLDWGVAQKLWNVPVLPVPLGVKQAKDRAERATFRLRDVVGVAKYFWPLPMPLRSLTNAETQKKNDKDVGGRHQCPGAVRQRACIPCLHRPRGWLEGFPCCPREVG